MDDAFAESLVHAPPPWRARLTGRSAHVVLGRRLRPFCLWHKFGLDAIRSPFAGHPGPVNLAALHLATRVCESEHPHLNIRSVAFSTLRACSLQYRYGRHDRLEVEKSRFETYRVEYDQGPIFGALPNSSAHKTPWYNVAVHQLLRDDPKLTEHEAWMLPVGSALWRIASAAEARGESIEIETEADRIAQREAAGG